MAILQGRLPFAPWADPRTRRLPGIQPLPAGQWLQVDDAFAAQMAERERLLDHHFGDVHALLPGAEAAAQELLERVLAELAQMPGYAVGPDMAHRPDGGCVTLDRQAPLATLGRLVQEDFCILQPGGAGEHVLTAAVLCFPASWTLAEKLGRPLSGIHRTVTDYDPAMAARVQRLFDAIRPETPLWRANALAYEDPALFQPRHEAQRHKTPAGDAPYIRSERQCLLRLPQSGAVVFSIHTFVVLHRALAPEQAAALAENPLHGA